MISQKYLKEILHYDPDTGEFTWLISNSNVVKIGDVAGTIMKGNGGKDYIYIGIDNKRYKAHRLAFLYMDGCFPEELTDHEDGNGLNNKWNNLSKATVSENCKNNRKRKDNTSGHTGVVWHKLTGKWQAQIRVNRKTKHLGLYVFINDAIIARKMAEYEYGFHKNHGADRPL